VRGRDEEDIGRFSSRQGSDVFEQSIQMSVALSVVHFIPGLLRQEGGPSRSVVRLTDTLSLRDDLAVTLISHSVPGLQSIPSSSDLVWRITSTTSNSIELKLGLVDRRLLQENLANQRVDLLHSHGLWHPGNHWATQLAAKCAIPLICQPRGMLEPWAVAHRAWKKRLALLLFQRTDLERVRAFIATSDMEAESIRGLGLRQPVAVIANGVDFPDKQSEPQAVQKTLERERVLLFLSRIHPKKGVIDLVRAWAQCAAPGWRLILAGPDEGGHLREVLQQVEQLGIVGRVEYVGELQGEAKAAMYRSADLFVLPSYSENFGMVIAEALSFGIPVITTRSTPWPGLISHNCGWWVETGVEPLIGALREAMALSDQDRLEMGKRSESYASEFQWSNAARQTDEFYRWLLGQGDRPAFVVSD